MENLRNDDFKFLEDKINGIDKKCDDLINEEKLLELLILLGYPGEGKTTLLHYLTGRNLISKKFKTKYIIETDNPFEDCIIREGPVSETTIPKYFNGILDCPGYKDNRGEIQNIVNAYSIFKFASIFKRIKIIAVFSEASYYAARNNSIINLLEIISKQFKNIDYIIKGFVLVFSKSLRLNEENKEDLKNELLDIKKNEENLKLSDNTRKLLEYLLSEKGKITFFKEPLQSGTLVTSENKNEILQVIKTAEFVEDFQIQIFHNCKSKQYIKDLLQNLQNNINIFLKNEFFEKIYTFFKNNLNKIFQISIDELEKYSELYLDIYRKYKELNIKNLFDKNFEIIYEIGELIIKYGLKDREFNEIYRKIKNFKDNLTFIKKAEEENFKIEENIYFEEYCENFKVIEILANFTKKHEIKENSLTITAISINIKNINRIIEKYNYNNFNEIIIFCLNTIYFDDNFIFPGGNMVIISPNWIISQEKNQQIYLKGKDIENYEEKAVEFKIDGKCGKDGNCGENGFDGGNFYGRGKTISNSEKLIIDVSGGKGGKGQDGADGKRGKDGVVEVKELIKRKMVKAKKLKDYAIETVKFLFTYNDLYEETYKIKMEGEEGGEPGKGGDGGAGGKIGKVNIEFRNNENNIEKNNIQVYNFKGKGKNGLEGRKGEKGNSETRPDRIYYNDIMLPTLFRIKEFDNANIDTNYTTEIKEAGRHAINLGKGVGAAFKLTLSIGKGAASVTGGVIALSFIKYQIFCSQFSSAYFSGWKNGKEIEDKDINEEKKEVKKEKEIENKNRIEINEINEYEQNEEKKEINLEINQIYKQNIETNEKQNDTKIEINNECVIMEKKESKKSIG